MVTASSSSVPSAMGIKTVTLIQHPLIEPKYKYIYQIAIPPTIKARNAYFKI
jgi:hypothetical protein